MAPDPLNDLTRKRRVETAVAEDLLLKRGWLLPDSGNSHLRRLVIRPRPGLRPFLDELKRWGDPYICTAGGSLYAETCLETIGVDHLFSGIYSIEDLENGVLDMEVSLPFLVDDLTPYDPWVLRKLRFVGLSFPFDFEETSGQYLRTGKRPDVDYGLSARHHFQMPAFLGAYNDNALSELLPQILRAVKPLHGQEEC